MKIAKSVASARQALRKVGNPLVLVPTMGALHCGHVALVRRARRLAGPSGTVVVSIFVNPTQFGPREDFSAYPRSRVADLATCRAEGVDLVFFPEPGAMYEEDHSLQIGESRLSRRLCGVSRPGHFAGVCLVVAKLFLILRPTQAIFGEKDWQQLAIIRRMVRDLNFPVRIVGQPTVREGDGLASSSRNLRLNAAERAVAPQFYAALRLASRGPSRQDILRIGRKEIKKIPGVRLDYLDLVDGETLEPVTTLRLPRRLVGAVYLGKTRLIDNLAVTPRK
jgi:pantoate--beta-alanine ligase